MAILIDGYNLMHVTGIHGRGHGWGKGSLERARNALLSFLTASLGPDELLQTTVVFDANEAPPGLPRQTKQGGMTIQFAAEYEDADALIEELIRVHSVPRQLIVVSSDHRVQRAARRRKATAIDSDRWFDEIVQRQIQREASPEPLDAKPTPSLSKADVQHWLAQFADADLESEFKGEANRKPQAKPSSFKRTNPSPTRDSSDKNEELDISNPFPPGYADDLFEDLDT